MDENELEGLALAKNPSSDAKFVLGRLMIEGSSDKVPFNEKKGLNWIKEAVTAGNMSALEYKTYHDIRFDSNPKLNKITENLQKIIQANQSCKALNVMGELAHAQASAAIGNEDEKIRAQGEEKATEAARFYMQSAEQGDILATHFCGTFTHLGFGVSKNLSKAVELLSKSADAGHCHSMYQLYLVYSGEEGQDEKMMDVEKAYSYLVKSL